MPSPSLTYTLTNGTTADADQVMQNFDDLLNGITDGTKDISVSALTAAGTATLNGSVNLGNASADDITITGSLASTIPIKTTNSYNIGSSTLGLAGIYFGANSQTVRLLGSGSMSATWSMTLPVSAGTNGYRLVTNGSGVTSWSKETLGTTTNDDAAAGDVGELIESTATGIAMTNATSANITSISLTAGDWDVAAAGYFSFASGTTSTSVQLGISKTSATLSGTFGYPTSGEITAILVYPSATNADRSLQIPPIRVSLSATTTIYLVAESGFSSSTLTTQGGIWARRVR